MEQLIIYCKFKNVKWNRGLYANRKPVLVVGVDDSVLEAFSQKFKAEQTARDKVKFFAMDQLPSYDENMTKDEERASNVIYDIFGCYNPSDEEKQEFLAGIGELDLLGEMVEELQAEEEERS